MNREQFEKEYLHKKVKITLFDDTKLEGVLYKTGPDCDEKFRYEAGIVYRHKYYFLVGHNNRIRFLFRKSHIKHISEVR